MTGSSHLPLVRRLKRRMIYWGLLVALGFTLLGDLRSVGILTVTVGLSIVHLRGLQAQVSALNPRQSSSDRARSLVLALTRYLLLITGLLLILYVDSSRPAAVVLGVSSLPAALFAETVTDYRSRFLTRDRSPRLPSDSSESE